MKPKLIEGEQRFEVNINTRALMYDAYGSSDQFRRIQSAHETISGKIEKVGKGDVGAIIRQAFFLLRGFKHLEAEQLLATALKRYPSDPDLFGVLGVIYKSWQPHRITDARENFYRAWQLKCSKQEMYEHWCKMEIREQEWTKAAEAAENGLKMISNNKMLLYLAGHSRSRLSKELRGGLHSERAKKEFSDAKKHLEKALRVTGDLKDRRLNAEIYRALVLTFEQTENIRKMEHYFKLWQKEFPDDPDLTSEFERIGKKYHIEFSNQYQKKNFGTDSQ